MRISHSLIMAGALALSTGSALAADEDAPFSQLVSIDTALQAAVAAAPEGAIVVEAELQDSDWSLFWGEGNGSWVWDIELVTPDQEEYEIIVDAHTGRVQEADEG